MFWPPCGCYWPCRRSWPTEFSKSYSRFFDANEREAQNDHLLLAGVQEETAGVGQAVWLLCESFSRGGVAYGHPAFDGKTTKLINESMRQDQEDRDKPKERHSAAVALRVAPDVYEGLQQSQSRTEAALRARVRRQSMNPPK
jgi:hypothetical protein